MYILDFVVNGWFEPQIYVGVIQNKPKVDWKANDTKKVQYDLKARKIVISFLGVNEYLYVSHCKKSITMWDTLETLHEDTEDVKKSKINTLTQQYEVRF